MAINRSPFEFSSFFSKNIAEPVLSVAAYVKDTLADEKPPPAPEFASDGKYLAKRHDHSKRQLVLCLDGTENQFSNHNTNVMEFFNCLHRDRDKQIVYYQTGIGTYTSWHSTETGNFLSKKLDAAIAHNLEHHVQAAYRFLMRNYKEGDQVSLFGFSRGAYTARVLAGFLQKVGLLPRENPEQIPIAWKLFTGTDSEAGKDLCRRYKNAICHPTVKIKFLGLWDTVASVGLFEKELPFIDPEADSGIIFFRQALALDKRRAFFRPNYKHNTRLRDNANGRKSGNATGNATEDVIHNAINNENYDAEDNANDNAEDDANDDVEDDTNDDTNDDVEDNKNNDANDNANDNVEDDVNDEANDDVEDNANDNANDVVNDDVEDDANNDANDNANDDVEDDADDGANDDVEDNANGNANNDVEDVANEDTNSSADGVGYNKQIDLVKEVWFAGCHSDVGGGAVLNSTPNSLSRISLRWMIKECLRTKTGIRFDLTMLVKIGFVDMNVPGAELIICGASEENEYDSAQYNVQEDRKRIGLKHPSAPEMLGESGSLMNFFMWFFKLAIFMIIRGGRLTVMFAWSILYFSPLLHICRLVWHARPVKLAVRKYRCAVEARWKHSMSNNLEVTEEAISQMAEVTVSPDAEEREEPLRQKGSLLSASIAGTDDILHSQQQEAMQKNSLGKSEAAGLNTDAEQEKMPHQNSRIEDVAHDAEAQQEETPHWNKEDVVGHDAEAEQADFPQQNSREEEDTVSHDSASEQGDAMQQNSRGKQSMIVGLAAALLVLSGALASLVLGQKDEVDSEQTSQGDEDEADALSPMHDQLSLNWAWWVLEFPSIIRLQNADTGRKEKETQINLGRGRKIYGDAWNEDEGGKFINVHESVLTRMKKGYKPCARFRYPGDGSSNEFLWDGVNVDTKKEDLTEEGWQHVRWDA